MKKVTLALSMGIAVTFFANNESALAQDYSASVYYRCYGHLVRSRPAANDPRLLAIKAQTKTSDQACLELLQLAQITPVSGDTEAKTIGGGSTSFDPIAKSVMATMNSFHRSWFQNIDWRKALSGGLDLEYNYDIYDHNEMAYHVTNALFNDQNDYSEVVTGATSFEAVRFANGDTNPDTFVRPRTQSPEVFYFENIWSQTFEQDDWPDVLERFEYMDSNGDDQEWFPSLVPTGELVGIRTMVEKANDFLPSNRSVWGQELGNIHTSKGGGILGTVPFLLLNLGRRAGTEMDGGHNVPRRWSQAVYNAVLCRELPVVRLTDVTSDNSGWYQTDASSDLPFRQGTTCMQCHSSMDNMAGVARNYTFARSVGYTDTGKATGHIFTHQVTENAETGRVQNSDNRYHERPANGRFFYRDFAGNLHDTSINGVQGLGNYLANMDDMYVCAAKRYFKYFTNIEVNITDLNGATLSAKEMEYRNFVIQLGQELRTEINTGGATKNHLQNMLRKIFASSAYRNPGTGVQ